MRLLVAALLVLLALATFAHVMARPVEPNEHMYLAASVLAGDAELYRDFAFVQMPYLPMLYSWIYRITGTDHYLLVARLVTWLVLLGSATSIAGIAWHYSRDIRLAVASVIVLVCCDSILLISGECSNYALACFMSLAAYWLFLVRSGRMAWGCVGLLLGLSAGVKLYYSVLVPVFMVAAWYRPQESADRRSGITALVVGVALGVLPAFVMLVADPDRFMFNNLGFHRWKTEVYQEIGYGARMTIHQRIQHGKSVLQHASQIWVLYVGVLSAWVLFRHHRKLNEHFDLLLAIGTSLVCLLTALVPVPAWSQYFAMPVPFFLVTAIVLAARQGLLGTKLMIVLAVAGLIVSGPYLTRAIGQLTDGQGWIPTALHVQSRDLVQRISDRRGLASDQRPLIATTRTLIALEGGGEIYPQWALSGFMFEISDRLSDGQIERYRVTSPRTVAAMLDQRPPDAIVTLAHQIDRPLIDYANRKGYRETKNEALGVSVWYPPE